MSLQSVFEIIYTFAPTNNNRFLGKQDLFLRNEIGLANKRKRISVQAKRFESRISQR